MNSPHYNIEEINIGDEILFDNKEIPHNLFWRVINKIAQNKLVVEIREMGYAERFSIDIRDVIKRRPGFLSFEQLSPMI